MDYNAFFAAALREFGKGIFSGLTLAWTLLGALLLLALARLALAIYRDYRLRNAGIYDVDEMDGRTFEKYLALIFERLGYEVELTPYQGDFGADLIVTRDGVRTAVQAKRSNGRVGVKAIQQVSAARHYYNCSEALVVTNTTFTPQAVELAYASGIKLWDRMRLVHAIISAGGKRPDMERRPDRPDETPTPKEEGPPGCCVRCGRAVAPSVRAYCLAHPKRFGGRVYCSLHQRRPLIRAWPGPEADPIEEEEEESVS